MTNNWTDIGNATLVLAMGCNPAENHPACMNHINRAREELTLTDAQGAYKLLPADASGSAVKSRKRRAKMIVIDPRKTRTARQIDESYGDMYIRIRPGTDIAFINGVVNYIVNNISSVSGTAATGFTNFLNYSGARTFTDDSGVDAKVTDASKFTDARFRLNASGTDYLRANKAVAGSASGISNFPVMAASITDQPDTVFMKLKDHVSYYDTKTVADICGCAEDDIKNVALAFIDNSRCSSQTSVVDETYTFPADDASGNPVARQLYASFLDSLVVKDASGNTLTLGVDYKASMADGTITRIAAAAGSTIKVSYTGLTNDPKSKDFRATSMLYAMGITQHTYGSQNCKSFAVLQTLMGNMGRPGGGINALRGIHNVQGSTDMGLLYGNIPAYSGNPLSSQSFGLYMDRLYGYRMRTGVDASGNPVYGKAYTDLGHQGSQQRGFLNMTREWFGHATITGTDVDATQMDAAYSLWPKNNGDDHITMFRAMGSGRIKAALVWGQNPGITEPNQGAVRAGLKNLDTLVCVDVFANETAECDRKDTGWTYLIPAASYIEEPGSVTNSGRVLQWRNEALPPQGNTKRDIELLLRFAKKVNDKGGFNHIKAVWDAKGISYDTDPYTELYKNEYGYDGVSNMTAAVAQSTLEAIYKQMNDAVANGGTMWIYGGAYNATYKNSKGESQPYRAKSRDNNDMTGNLLYPDWGFAWLANRRVFYNNGEIIGDVADGFQGPDQCSRLFVSTNTATIDYSKNYRTIHTLADKPDTNAASGQRHFLSGRFPGHTEPYETPRTDVAAVWGRNTKGGTKFNLVKDDTKVAGRGYVAGVNGKPVTDPAVSEFPFILTTIRCVEHFQGGPITRNNAWNVEIEPEPWVEINSLDAIRLGIKNGQWVDVVTARSNSVDDENARTKDGLVFSKGFRARVGVGVQANQRVAPGVVAVPWHWGDRGLATGARANDLCIDAVDANSAIPEYKACLCNLVPRS